MTKKSISIVKTQLDGENPPDFIKIDAQKKGRIFLLSATQWVINNRLWGFKWVLLSIVKRVLHPLQAKPMIDLSNDPYYTTNIYVTSDNKYLSSTISEVVYEIIIVTKSIQILWIVHNYIVDTFLWTIAMFSWYFLDWRRLRFFHT